MNRHYQRLMYRASLGNRAAAKLVLAGGYFPGDPESASAIEGVIREALSLGYPNRYQTANV